MPRDLIFHIINLILAIISFVVIVSIIFRTKKDLDKAFKLFLGTAITLIVATSMQINGYTLVIPISYEEPIFIISRFLATLFFLFGCVVMLRIVSRR